MLSTNLKENIKHINNMLGVGYSYDVSFRKFKIYDKEVYLYFLEGLVNNEDINSINEVLLKLPQVEKKEDYFQIICNNIIHKDITIIDDYQKIYDSVLSGCIVFVIEDSIKAISIQTRNFPTRSISEPDTEKVIRGSHDGFVESLNVNIALVRRRIKDGKLRNKMIEIGVNSKTFVCLSYIEGICDQKLVDDVYEKLNKIKVSHLIMTDKALEELLIKQKFNPYPLVRYTERADIVSVHLYKGYFAIFVDTSPSVILAPATFFDHLQHAEEYRQTPISGTYLRFLRFIGVILSIFLTPIWFLIVINYIKSPELFNIFIPEDKSKLNIFLQLMSAEAGVEFLRMASIHTPSALSTAMGLVAGILIGDIAISVGVFSIQTVFLVAICAIGTYITPSYELGLANKISKLIFIISIYFFGLIGFIVTFCLWLLFLITRKSFGIPYLYPLIPLNLKKLKEIIIRVANKEKKNA